MRHRTADIFHRRKFLRHKTGDGVDVSALDRQQEVIGPRHKIAAGHFRELVHPLSKMIKADVLLGSDLDLDERPDMRMLGLRDLFIKNGLIFQDDAVFLVFLDRLPDLGWALAKHLRYLFGRRPGVLFQYF